MATQRKIPPPETVAYARRRYRENAVVEDILGETGLSLGVLYRCIDGLYDDGSGLPAQPLPRRIPYRGRRPALGRVRANMAGRLWRTGESYVRALEERLARADLSEGAREGDARVFAIMVRAMRELMETGASARPPQPVAAVKADLPRPRTMTRSPTTSRNSAAGLRSGLQNLQRPRPRLKRRQMPKPGCVSRPSRNVTRSHFNAANLDPGKR